MINTSMRRRTRMMVVSRSDHCSVNIGEGVIVTGNYPEVNTVNMWVNPSLSKRSKTYIKLSRFGDFNLNVTQLYFGRKGKSFCWHRPLLFSLTKHGYEWKGGPADKPAYLIIRVLFGFAFDSVLGSICETQHKYQQIVRRQNFTFINARAETSFLSVDGEGNFSWEGRRDMATGRDEHGCSQVAYLYLNLYLNLQSGHFKFESYFGFSGNPATLVTNV